jgi:pimeloyl-ACP methyl ester carboxylesterase
MINRMARQFLILAAVMIGIGIAMALAVVFGMARMLLRPKRMTDARALFFLHRLSPDDLAMPFEDVTFRVIDEQTGRPLKIAAWWIPTQGSKKCAVLIHGYSDAKVGGIAWAPMLRSLGFNVLAIDLRAHGESDGLYSTAGFWERHDVSQVLDQTRAARPGETEELILFGISLGAATAAATAALRSDLSAVILEAPFADFESATHLHADRMGAPGPVFQRAAYRLAQRLAGADFSAVRPVDTIPQIQCPLLVIQSGDDPFLTDADHAAIAQAVASQHSTRCAGVCWDIPGVHHVLGIMARTQDYHRRIEEFLSQALPKSV